MILGKSVVTNIRGGIWDRLQGRIIENVWKCTRERAWYYVWMDVAERVWQNMPIKICLEDLDRHDLD